MKKLYEPFNKSWYEKNKDSIKIGLGLVVTLATLAVGMHYAKKYNDKMDKIYSNSQVPHEECYPNFKKLEKENLERLGLSEN